MARNFIKTLVISTVLISGISVNTARAGNQQLGEFLAATIFMFALADVMSGSSQAAPAPRPVRPAPNPVYQFDQRKWLPSVCQKTHLTQQGKVTVYGKVCLQKNYPFYRQLPQRCEQTLWTSKGIREGYAPSCLRRFGYRFER